MARLGSGGAGLALCAVVAYLVRNGRACRREEAVIRVQAEDFDVGAEIAAIRAEARAAGAVVSFTGIVRGGTGATAIRAMTLEHYPGMTERELERIDAEARERWPLAASLILHRFGRLLPGDNIVLVVTASSHRQAAFEAAEFLMDYLKTSAPFWKKEERAEGDGDWVEAKVSDDAAAERWS
jgi:molybdopterin synthase catalytic subunit